MSPSDFLSPQLEPSNGPNGLLLPPIKTFNVVAEKEVLTNPAQENAGLINGNKIKWRWPRIESAGVLSTAPTGSGPSTVTLKAGNGAGFKPNDEVYLRKKGLKPVVHLNQVDSPQYSSKLTVTSVVGDVITVTGAVTIASWAKDDVLVRLTKAVVDGKGTISVAGTTVTGVGTYFGVQVNPVGASANREITVKIGAAYETRTVTSVASNTSLQINAGLIGAMARRNIYFLGWGGFSMADGGPGVSSTHTNGENGDIRYLRFDRTGNGMTLYQVEFDYDAQVDFNNSLFAYGYGQTDDMLTEHFTLLQQQTTLYPNDVGTEVTLPHSRHFADIPNNVRHYHHLHLQGFDPKMIFVIF